MLLTQRITDRTLRNVSISLKRPYSKFTLLSPITLSSISNSIYVTYLLVLKFQRRIQNPVTCLTWRFLQK